MSLEDQKIEVPENDTNAPEELPTDSSSDPISQETTTIEEQADEVAPATTSGKKKKSVGFAPLPEEDLKEHHEEVHKKEQERAKSNPFHKIPPELAYLEKKSRGPGPKALPTYKKPAGTSAYTAQEIGNLRHTNFKEISIQNKETELNFNYPYIDLPIPAHQIVVNVKFASLNSYDLAKINQYLLNLSNMRVGLGYEFAGVISDVGTNWTNSTEYKVGDVVIGIVDPIDKKGSLSSSLLINPKRDVLIKVDDAILAKASTLDVELSFDKAGTEEGGEFEVDSSDSSDESIAANPPVVSNTPVKDKRKSSYAIEDEIPALAKLATFPVLYCRAKQMLEHVKLKDTANVLINGADTNLGFTLVQLLNSSVYSFDRLNIILIVRESSYKYMSNFVSQFTKGKYYDPSKTKNITVLTFDSVNEDLVLPGEKVPINYKKPSFFASEVIAALFEPNVPEIDSPINESNIQSYKLDIIIDLVGSKKFFQTSSIKYEKLDEIQLPLKIHTNAPLSKIFNSKVKEPFLVKILKPKKSGSAFVSGCKFALSEPTYTIDKQIDYAEMSALNPWTQKWSSNLFNSWTYYNYYEDLELKVKRDWILEGLELLLDGSLKFRIDDYIDWRNNYRAYIKQLKVDDGKVLFKIEDF
ncbi:uncharacterized protein RJT20DRAFT_62943 [Scheffersomyces xylosifermentans]|uniref:uncharacterized protein n=1 Tax=Scheffersomyces xylosifermentans TaxID=1304137 RepID=UPI00315DAD60